MAEEYASAAKLREVSGRLERVRSPQDANPILWRRLTRSIGTLTSDLLTTGTPPDILRRLRPELREVEKVLNQLVHGRLVKWEDAEGPVSRLEKGLLSIVHEHPTLQFRYQLEGLSPEDTVATGRALRETALYQTQQLGKLEKDLDELKQAVSPALLANLRERVKEIENMRDALRKLVVEAGQAATTLKVGDYHRIFLDTSQKHRRQATSWPWSTGVLALLTLGVSIVLLLLGYNSPNAPDSEIGVAIGKSAILLILVSATVWAGLNYRSHLHNAVVNEHRSDSLGSYDAFYAAATTAEAKAAVLMQATGAIYAPQPSGFVSHDGEATTSGIGILGAVLAAKGGRQ